MSIRTSATRSIGNGEMTLFDFAHDTPITQRSATATKQSHPARASRQRLPVPDDHPDARQRFDVFFTHEQMIALNGTSSLAFERWGIRVNKSQLLRALVGALENSRDVLQELVEEMPVSPLPPAPPKAAEAEVYRRFESQLIELLSQAIGRKRS